MKGVAIPRIYNPTLAHGCNIFVGPSNSGKTYALQTLITKCRDTVDNFFVISRVLNTRFQWKEYFKNIGRKATVMADLEDGFINWLEGRQINSGTAMLILDDILGSISVDSQINIKANKAFDFLAYNGRHMKVITCILMQTPTSVLPGQSASAATSFIFNFPSTNMRENHIFPKFITQCDQQFEKFIYSMSRRQRYMFYHSIFRTLLRWECLVILRSPKNGSIRLYSFKA